MHFIPSKNLRGKGRRRESENIFANAFMQQFRMLKSWGFANSVFALEEKTAWISLDSDLKI